MPTKNQKPVYESAHIIMPDGKKKFHTVRGKTAAEAKRKKRALEERNRRGWAPGSNDTPTVAEWMKAWLEEIVSPYRSHNTHRYYSYLLRIHIAPRIGHIRMTDLTYSIVQTMINDLNDSGLKPSTVRGAKNTLSIACKHAIQRQIIIVNPATNLALPKKARAELETLNEDQIRLLRENLSDEWYGNAILTALFTGMRCGEIGGLTWADIDFDLGAIQVSHQLQRINSKLELKEPKSLSGRRTIAMTAFTRAILLKQRDWFEARQRELGWDNPMNLVFLTESGLPLDNKYLNTNLKRALKKVGLPMMRFHDLRHTAATHMLAREVPLHTVSKIMGHSQISLTADLYGHGTLESQRLALNKYEQVFE